MAFATKTMQLPYNKFYKTFCQFLKMKKMKMEKTPHKKRVIKRDHFDFLIHGPVTQPTKPTLQTRPQTPKRGQESLAGLTEQLHLIAKIFYA